MVVSQPSMLDEQRESAGKAEAGGPFSRSSGPSLQAPFRDADRGRTSRHGKVGRSAEILPTWDGVLSECYREGTTKAHADPPSSSDGLCPTTPRIGSGLHPNTLRPALTSPPGGGGIRDSQPLGVRPTGLAGVGGSPRPFRIRLRDVSWRRDHQSGRIDARWQSKHIQWKRIRTRGVA